MVKLIYLIIAILLIATAHGYIQDDIVAYYNLSNNIMDSGPNNYSLTYYGNYTYTQSMTGTAIKITEGWISNNTIDDNLTGTMSYCVWFNMTGFAIDDSMVFVASSCQQASLADCFSTGIYKTTGYVETVIYNISQRVANTFIATADYRTGWNHVCFTYNSGEERGIMYMNGEVALNGTEQQNKTVPTGQTWPLPIYFGAKYGLHTNPGWLYNGWFDDIAVFDNALSFEQVRALYNEGEGCNPYTSTNDCGLGGEMQIYIKAYDNTNTTRLNAQCTDGDEIVYSEESYLTTNNSLYMTLTCTYPGYHNFSQYYTGPLDDEYNISMQPNLIKFMFFDERSDGAATVEGVFTVREDQINIPFYNSTFSINSINVSEGARVEIYFNNQSRNWTQFYEFRNDNNDEYMQNISVWNYTALPEGIMYSNYHLKVIDYSNSPIPDAQIKLYVSDEAVLNTILHYDEVMGQRLMKQSIDSGSMYFRLAKLKMYNLLITADGYKPYYYILNPLTESKGAYDEPISIRMSESSDSRESVYVWIDRTTYNNRTTHIYGGVFAYPLDGTRRKVQIKTNVNTNLQTLSATMANSGKFIFDLSYAHGDYNYLGTDLTIYIYVDDELWGTKTIQWNNPQSTVISVPTSTTDSNWLRILFPIAVILIVIIMRALFVSTDDDMGVRTFELLAVISPLISPYYIWLSITILLGFVVKMLKGSGII